MYKQHILIQLFIQKQSDQKIHVCLTFNFNSTVLDSKATFMRSSSAVYKCENYYTFQFPRELTVSTIHHAILAPSPYFFI